MNRYTLLTISTVFLIVAIALGYTSPVFALGNLARPAQQSSLPQFIFLGEGPGTFTIDPGLTFLVKTYQNGEFLFVYRDGPTYEAVARERVWTTNFIPAEEIRLFHQWRSYGNVAAGCVVNYVQIEDNIDDRRNTFFINGKTLQVVEQGMVTYGNFTVPEAGELTFYAEDSIGILVELCAVVNPPAPSDTPVPTFTETLTPTATVTVEAPTYTPTITATATQQPPVETTPPTEEVVIPSPTASNTPEVSAPTATVTTPAASTLPSSTPRVVLVTATPRATPNAIPVTGGVPGPREIAMVIAALIGLFGILAAGWWFLVRASRNGW